MAVIQNTWVEKVKSHEASSTLPAYKPYKNDFDTQTKSPKKCHTPYLVAIMDKTLQGVRK